MGIFSVPPDLPVTKSKEEINKTYRYWRLHLMITSYIGYAVFYFTRKSFNFVMPAMLTDLGLQLSLIHIFMGVDKPCCRTWTRLCFWYRCNPLASYSHLFI